MSGNQKYLKRVTVENRILLLLLEHIEEIDRYSVPELLSQGGMSKKLSLRQNNLSRELQGLLDKGLLTSRTSHINGLQRKRRAYFLTPKGIDLAKDLVSQMGSSLVVVRDLDGEIREWTLSELVESASRELRRRVTYFEAVEDFLSGNEADLLRIIGRKPPRVESGAPLVKEFIGRDQELKYLSEALIKKGGSFVSVLGLAGQGKTSLMSYFLKKNSLRSVWLKINKWMNPSSFISGIESGSRQLEGGMGSLSVDDITKDLNAAAIKIESHFRSRDLVLVLDDAHLIGGDLHPLIELLKDRIVHVGSGLKLALLGRERPAIYTRTEAEHEDRMYEIQIEGLDRSSVSRMLGSRNVPSPLHDEIFRTTRGHPLTLSLLSSNPEADLASYGAAVNRLVEDEVLSTLDGPSISVLEMVSMMEIPVSRDLLYELPSVDRQTVQELVSKMLLLEYGDGSVDLHDMIKDTVRPTINSKDLRRYETVAYLYYSKRGGDQDLLQSLDLAYRLRRMDDLVSLISDHGEYLIGKGYHYIEGLVEELEGSVHDPSTQILLLLIRSDRSMSRSDFDEAREILREASRKAELITDETGVNSRPYLMSKIVRRFAEIKAAEGSMKDVIALYGKSLSLVERSGDRREMARVYTDLSKAYLQLDEFDPSIENLLLARSIYRELGDDRGLATSRMDLGLIYLRKLELANSLRELLHAVRVSEENGYERVRIKGLYWIGRLYLMVMQPDEAAMYFRTSLSGSISTGDASLAFKTLTYLVSSIMKSRSTRAGERVVARLRRRIGRGWKSLMPWMRINVTGDVDSLRANIRLFEGFLKAKDDLKVSGITEHLEWAVRQDGGASVIELVNSTAWALSRDFETPSDEYLDLAASTSLARSNKRLSIAITFSRATSTWMTEAEVKTEMRKVLTECTKIGYGEGRERAKQYLSTRVAYHRDRNI
ncbi:MAG: hypothetical protein ACMUHB_01860 [Thermoplasmatota archaeon]